MTSAEPYTAVIFTSRQTGDDLDGYDDAAAHMASLAAQQPGFRGIESARGTDGIGITVSYWNTDDDARAWKQQSEHLAVQQQGRRRWYAWYRVRVATVEREYTYHQDHVWQPTDPGQQ